MRVTKPLRSRKAVKRLDTNTLRALARDGRVWVDVGVVVKAPGDAAHWRKVDSNGRTDIMVSVDGVTTGQEWECRLSAAAGSVAQGLWRVPAVGDEVVIAVPAGDVSFMPVIVSALGSGQVPERAGADKTVLVATDELQLQVGGKVVRVKGDKIQIGDTAAEPLVLGNQLVNLLTTMLNLLLTHVHPSAIPNGPSAQLAPFSTEVATIQRIISDIAFTQKA
jgi:hypothetical protein